MGNFDRDNRSGGRDNFSRRSFGGRGGDRQMYSAVCSECGKDCQLPFKPTSGKPVFCSECFEKKGGGSSPRRSEDRNNRQPQNNAQIEIINSKLDKILEMLKPVVTKPLKEPKIEKEIEIQTKKPIAVVKKRARASKKNSSK